MNIKGLFERHVVCPVCTGEFDTVKMHVNAPRVQRRDPDFYTVYTGENPLYYAIFVCPHCGYSAFEKDFKEVSEDVRETIYKAVSRKWNRRDYGGLRSTEEALEVYKLALLCYTLTGASNLTIGKIAMRIGWLYKELDDPKYLEFMKHTITYFEKAYTTENLSGDAEEEITMQFIMGEYHRQLGNFKEAVRWFSKALEHPEVKKKRHLEQRIRQQWETLTAEYRSQKQE